MHMPDPFREYYSPAAQGAIRSYVQGLSREYAVPVVDMRDWVEDRDFFDGVHLTHAGAAAFTERFGREVLWPLLARRRRYCSLPGEPAPGPDYRP
jgi:hypothetical protein